jgi:hypothetical protein
MTQSPALAPFTMSPSTLRERTREFFFAEEAPYGLALMRILLPISLAGNLIRRWPWVRDMFSADGAAAPLADNFGYPDMLPLLPGSVAVALFTLMMLCFVTASMGLFTRLSIVISATLYWYFAMVDSVSTITKYTVILTHLFLILSLSGCGSVWSVDAWMARRRGAREPFGIGTAPRFPIWPARLVQLFLGVVYLGAAVTKLHTPIFFSGDQLMYWMMTHMMSYAPLGDLLSQYPLLLSVFSYVTIVWEIAFIFCVWFPMLRLPMLIIGATFHVMTAVTLGLLVFPMVMISAYFAFMTEADVQWCAARLRRLSRRVPSLGMLMRRVNSGMARLMLINPLAGRQRVVAGVFATLAAVVVMAGVEIEYRNDLYGQRRPEGRYQLQPMDTTLAESMVSDDKPLREKDKLHALDLGTWMAGDHLVDRRRTFSQGERIIVQASVNPPRDDLWLDCQLVDSDGHVVTKVGQIMPREIFRTHFTFFMNIGLQPGDYAIVLKSAGTEVARRKFQLTGTPIGAGMQPAAVSAN